ncbi:hypothetical protein CANARDRAFT_177184 [[Candida] arabinofermentans NRRL YB-2248]|uniref:Palmitoyl-protein thioesterase 1 n=1 Tax=[Candida] arabinofermentans NRRL YB-2248 TaxID=983967 RepID=A0A1E4SWZ2_9ASCO|nr:hypothetical protein CANARDRAFT_177184 [[Candida] arabinofermentans NRRL YB-2248]
MGDSYNSSSMQRVQNLLKSAVPDLFIHSIYLDTNDLQDQKASVAGDLNVQILNVCDQLNDIPQLSNGFNAIGFSQGGLFLRSAMEICGLPISNLITYGSPHNGVIDLPPCPQGNWLCQKRNELLKKQIYKPNIQRSIVQAQYFRDVYNYDTYLAESNFLKFVNNDQANDENSKDWSYYDNFVKLNRFVMIMFLQDDMLTPKETSWFFDTDPITGDSIRFDMTKSFEYDLIGLKTLFNQGKIDFLTIDDTHMSIEDEHLKLIAMKYL